MKDKVNLRDLAKLILAGDENEDQLTSLLNVWFKTKLAYSLEEVAYEEPINGNNLAQARILMKARWVITGNEGENNE